MRDDLIGDKVSVVEECKLGKLDGGSVGDDCEEVVSMLFERFLSGEGLLFIFFDTRIKNVRGK